MSVAPALVVDLGAAFTKVGFAGNLNPCLCCPTVVREFGDQSSDADADAPTATATLPPSWRRSEASLADRLLGTLGVDPSDPSAISALVVVESRPHTLGGSGGGGGGVGGGAGGATQRQQQQQQNSGGGGNDEESADADDQDAAAELAEAAFEALGVQALRVEPAAPCALLGFQLLAASAERQGRPGPSGGGAIGAGRQQQQQHQCAAAAAAAAARLNDLAAAVQAATATGLVIDAGAESTRIVPVVDGYALAAAALELPPVAAMAADERERRWRRRRGRGPVDWQWQWGAGGGGGGGGLGQEDGSGHDEHDLGPAVAAVVAEAVDAAVCCAPVDARRALLAGVVLTGGGGAAGGGMGGGSGSGGSGAGGLLSRRAVEAAVAKAARARMGPGAKPLDACAVRDPSAWGHAAWAGASALAALWSSDSSRGGAHGGGAQGSSWGGGVVGSSASLEQVCVTREAYEELGAWRAGVQARANAAVLRGLPMLF